MDDGKRDQENIKLPPGLCALAGCTMPMYMSPGLYRDHLRASAEGAILNTLMVLRDLPPGGEASYGEMVSEPEIDGAVKELDITAVEVPSDEPYIILFRASEVTIERIW